MSRSGKDEILQLLTANGIAFRCVEHPAVFTCEQAAVHLQDVPGIGTKNLFLRNKKGDRQLLVSVPESKEVDLRALEKALGVSRLSFGSSERLMRALGVEPGSVTILGLCNDTEQAVEFFIDEALVGAGAIQCHPLVNTATVVLSWTGIESFLKAIGRTFQTIAVPSVAP